MIKKTINLIAICILGISSSLYTTNAAESCGSAGPGYRVVTESRSDKFNFQNCPNGYSENLDGTGVYTASCYINSNQELAYLNKNGQEDTSEEFANLTYYGPTEQTVYVNPYYPGGNPTTDAHFIVRESCDMVSQGSGCANESITGVPESQCLALFDFYNNFDGDNWTNNTNWLDTSVRIDTWNGVSFRNGNISNISLNSNNVTGDIKNLNLSPIVNLEFISLTGNSVSGDIGNFNLTNNTNLTNIFLQSNSISGDIGNFNLINNSQLVFINLSYNNLTGDILGFDLTNNNNLIGLSLIDNDLHGSLSGLNLGSRPGFRQLDINYNKFVFNGIEGFINNVTKRKYAPQDKVDSDRIVTFSNGGELRITPELAENPSGNDTYTWYKDGLQIPGATERVYVKNNADSSDVGTYYYRVKNSTLPDLTLISNEITVVEGSPTGFDCSNESITGVPESECLDLVALYNNFDGDNWTKKTNWLTNTSIDDWEGISVSGGNVFRITLNNGNLTGDVSDLNFPGISLLKDIAIGSNSGITGDISGLDLISNTSLETLGISYNSISGNISGLNLSNNINLGGLYLNNNNISGAIGGLDVESNTSLINISLGDNNISGAIGGLDITKNTALSSLNLRGNNITGNIGSLDTTKNIDLRVLGLNNNNISGNISGLNLSNNSELVSLNISFNTIEGNIEDLDLSNSSNIILVTLKNNNLTGSLSNFINYNKLSRLSVQNNKLLFSGIEGLYVNSNKPTTFEYSPQDKVDSIRTIGVAEGANFKITPETPENPSGNDRYQWFKDGVAISGATSRVYSKTNFSSADEGIYTYQITNTIVNGLTLESNEITVEEQAPFSCINNTQIGIPQAECEDLVGLYNNFDGLNWNNNDNWLTNTPADDWFGVTVTSGRVSSLSLGINAVTGSISDLDLSSLTSLEVLNLSSSFSGARGITGDVANMDLSGLTNLKSLSFDFQKLSGNIGDLSLSNNIQSLFLSANNLSGDIEGLMALPNLRYIDLDQNNILSGNIHLFDFGAYPLLEYFSVGSTFATGLIEGDIGLLDLSGVPSLEYFRIAGHKIGGDISTMDVSGNPDLDQIIISYNSIYGEIGSSFIGKNMDISNNNFVHSDIEFIRTNSTHFFGSYVHTYSPQAKVDTDRELAFETGTGMLIEPSVEINPSGNDEYQWYKDGVFLTGATNRIYSKAPAELSDSGVYTYTINNSTSPNLELLSNNITVQVAYPAGWNVSCNTGNNLGIPRAECEALKIIYDNLGGLDWVDNTNWGSDTDVNTWFGLARNDTNLIKLDLNNNKLRGNISDVQYLWYNLSELEIFRLNNVKRNTYTESFDETDNIINGNLSELYLEFNTKFKEIDFSYLRGVYPPSNNYTYFGGMANSNDLEVYNLEGLRLAGDPAYLGLQNKPKLRILNLANNRFNGDIAGLDLANKPDLEYFNIAQNSINGDAIGLDLGNKPNLTYVDAQSNRISGDVSGLDLSNKTNLEHLNFRSNLISGNISGLNIGDKTSLSYLNFAYNQISGDISGLNTQNKPNLTYLRFHNNQITGDMAGLNVQDSPVLEYLDFEYNQVSGDIVDFNLESNVELETLIFRNNQITGDIPDFNLTNNIKLKILEGGYNQIGGDIGNFDLTNNTDIETIWMFNNQIGGDIGNFDLTNNPKLVSLYLLNNEIGGDIGNFDLTNNPELEDAYLYNNEISGNIGDLDLTNTLSLTQLRLTNNQITGNIGDLDLSGATALLYLALGTNQISGSIGDLDLSSASELASLQLSNNNITGALDISSNTNFSRLYVEGNRIIFSDIESRIGDYNSLNTFNYSPQQNVDTDRTLSFTGGETITIVPELPENTSGNDTYQWYKDNVLLAGATSRIYTKNNSTAGDAGVYTYRVNNSVVTGLELISNNITVNVSVTPLSINDIGEPNPANGTNMLATNSKSIEISVNGATFVEGYFENYNETDFDQSTAIPYTTNSDTLTFDANVSNVRTGVSTNGARGYYFKITKICNAGGCIQDYGPTGLKSFEYSVYANTLQIGTKRILDNEVNEGRVADGSESSLTVELKDIYGNPIVPGADINRTIDLTMSVSDNNLNRNQLRGSGPTAVDVKGPNSSVFNQYDTLDSDGNNSITFNSGSVSLDTLKTYNIDFKVYAPTGNIAGSNGQQYSDGSFKISGITFEIQSDQIEGANVNVNGLVDGSEIDFDYIPLNYTVMSGDVPEDGFIEGAEQTSQIEVRTNSTFGVQTARELRLEYGGSNSSDENAENIYFDLFDPNNKIAELPNPGNGTTVSSNYPISTDIDVTTRLEQQTATVSSSSKSYLATIIKYVIDGYEIIYPSRVLGKTSYSGTFGNDTENTNQVGIKVVGTTSSDDNKSGEITDNQEGDINAIAGSIQKAELKREIVTNATIATRGVNPNNGNRLVDDFNFSNDEAGIELRNGNILYFGNLAGSKVDINSSSPVTGSRTIIVKGGDLFIRQNIIKSSNSILGLVVMKDSDDRGGNIYIHPDVTRIDAIIYAEKSLMSSTNGTSAMSDNSQEALKNQLFIKGSVFSENTIGGSKKNPRVCPYYVASPDCSTNEQAQKYDLNYLRRYFVVDDNGDGIYDRAANGGQNYRGVFNQNIYTNSRNPLVIEYDTTLQLDSPPVFDK